MYNYAKLIAGINHYGGVEKLSNSIGVDYRTISDKLLGKRSFKQDEIEKIIALLGIDRNQILELFFNRF